MSHGTIDVSAGGDNMNQNQPFVLEMAFRFVALHRAGESKKALWLRKQRQAMTIDDHQLKGALAVIYMDYRTSRRKRWRTGCGLGTSKTASMKAMRRRAP